MEREISKFVECPPLTPGLQELLTELIYIPNDPQTKTDCIFVFGNRNFSDTAHKIQELIDKNISDLIIISGGTPRFEDSQKSDDLSESRHISSLLEIPYDSPTKVLLESQANNTRENVSNSLPLFPPDISGLTFVCLWYISRRARLSLQKFLPPSVRMFQQALPKKDPDSGIIIGPDSWFVTKTGRDRTFAEYLRIKTYGERGDIFYDSKTSNLVKSIYDESSHRS
jgi:hypothetical protein